MQKEGNDETTGARKTLKQQLSENRRRFQEYQTKLQTKNSTFLLDKKAAKFYDDLKQKELEKGRMEKEQKAIEKRLSDQAKEQEKALAKAKSLEAIKNANKPNKVVKITKKVKTIETPKPVSSILSGYTSSEDDEEN
ncbi:hypothetical protein G210_2977 [Candida maltosa Xu316]|uniref:FAM192A/Fyv6 N-terminal domain-containing protein n=1 Tax=Candida maltosa (strain Xu316) TaxID=1245528 RepID=M3J474_CANMX|nr:hypothetical protein G210_2977 [Candida maltosa Xu316]